MYLSNLIMGTSSIKQLSGPADAAIEMITSDSRKVGANSVFVALVGAQIDGHDYIHHAINNGAIAVLFDESRSDSLADQRNKFPENIIQLSSTQSYIDYADLCAKLYSARPAMLVGVTGTNGKTSCCEYMRQIWTKATWSSAAIGTLGVSCPIPELEQMSASLTTPPPEYIFRMLHQLTKKHVTHIAFEASSHGLDQSRLHGLGVNVAVFTNLSQDHLDWHGNMERYFEAKILLFTENLLDGGTAIINADDPWAHKIIDRLKDRPVVIWTVGTKEDADFHIQSINSQSFGLDIKINAKGVEFFLPVALSGAFQAYNAVISAVAVYASGMPLQDSFGALPALQSVRGRMQPVHGHPLGARVIIDYAHTPDALKAALLALRGETSGKLHLVFGCGGNRDKTKRAIMGEIASTLADHIIITDDNPRHENPAAIRAEIQKACPQADNIANRNEAIKQAITALGSQDTVLIAGKGHESVQMMGTETLPFDDASVARHVLAQLGEQEKGG